MNWFKIAQLVLQYIPVLIQLIKDIMAAFENESPAVKAVAKQNLSNVLAKKDVDGLKQLCSLHEECKLK